MIIKREETTRRKANETNDLESWRNRIQIFKIIIAFKRNYDYYIK